MGAIADDVAAFEADMERHLDRLNADVRWGGDALTLADVDAAGEGDGRDYTNLALLSHLIAHVDEFDGVFPVDGTNLYLAMVCPYGRAYKEYYATTAGRALVRALLDAWRMTDEQVAKADRAWRKRRAEGYALQVLAVERGVSVDEMIDLLAKVGT